MATYQKEIEDQYKLRLRKITSELPAFLDGYFMSITSKSLRTQISYARDILTFFKFITLENPLYKNYQVKDIPYDLLQKLTPSDIDEYIKFLDIYFIEGKKYTNDAASKARKLSVLNNMFTFYNTRNYFYNNPVSAVIRPKIHEKAVVALDQDQIYELVEMISNPKGLSERSLKSHQKTVERDLAIVCVFLGTGIRVSELVGLNIDDINFKDMSLRIIRKGGDEKRVYFNEDVTEALLSYIGIESEEDEEPIYSPRTMLLGSNTEEKALFISMKGRRMAVRSIETMIEKYTSCLCINKKITPHKLRSTYATEIYRQTGDIYLVSSSLDHKNINTSKKYTRQDEERKKQAAGIITLKAKEH